MKDAFLIVGILSVVLGVFAIFKLWYWTIFFGIVALALGIVELVRVKREGKTLSQRFWAFRKENPAGSWLVVGVLALFWIVLLIHLVWR